MKVARLLAHPSVGRSHAPGDEAMSTATMPPPNSSRTGPASRPLPGHGFEPPSRGPSSARRRGTAPPRPVPGWQHDRRGFTAGPHMIPPPAGHVFRPPRSRRQDWLRRGLHGGRLGHRPDTDLADLLTPLASNVATLVPQPLQRFRRLVERRQPAGRAGHAITGETEHPSPLRPVERPVRGVPRRDAELLLGPVRGRRRSRPRANDERSTPSWTSPRSDPAARCSRSVPAGASSPSRPRSAAPASPPITLSSEQRDLALRRAAEAGVSDHVRILLADYREVTGEFDTIVERGDDRSGWRALLARLLRHP